MNYDPKICDPLMERGEDRDRWFIFARCAIMQIRTFNANINLSPFICIGVIGTCLLSIFLLQRVWSACESKVELCLRVIRINFVYIVITSQQPLSFHTWIKEKGNSTILRNYFMYRTGDSYRIKSATHLFAGWLATAGGRWWRSRGDLYLSLPSLSICTSWFVILIYTMHEVPICCLLKRCNKVYTSYQSLRQTSIPTLSAAAHTVVAVFRFYSIFLC